MRYEILGPLRVVDEGDVSFISAPKIERLLAVLLVRANHLVTVEQLATEIWDGELPRRATAGLYVYVSQLRKFLGRRGSSIVTKSPGYLLQLGSDELDVLEFLQLAAEGRELARRDRYEEAAGCFEAALGLWRGSVLSDLPRGPVIDAFTTWLDEERLECVEQWIDARLALGRHREIVGRLYSLTAEHPLRESFYRQLMLALYRSERQGDALKVYQSARQTLSRELGVEPCRSLQSIQHAILAADNRLDRVARWEAPIGDGSAA